MITKYLTIFLVVFTIIPVSGQDTLPRFSVKNLGNNKIIIGWVNNFETVKQISIQRSFDSLSGFKTILTVPDPTTRENGFVDSKATNDHMFYRLYILLDKGNYLFSKVKKPVTDSVVKKNKIDPFSVRIDSIFAGDSSAIPKPGNGKIKPNAFTPSLYVYTNKDGYLRITLPDNEKPKKYTIKFFEETGEFLFELKEVKEKNFRLDKTNFYHAGWFTFELYGDDKLVEKHKFFLSKDF